MGGECGAIQRNGRDERTDHLRDAREQASVTLRACPDDDTDDETVTLMLTTTGISGLRLGSPTTVVVTIADDDSAYDGSNDGWGL